MFSHQCSSGRCPPPGTAPGSVRWGTPRCPTGWGTGWPGCCWWSRTGRGAAARGHAPSSGPSPLARTRCCLREQSWSYLNLSHFDLKILVKFLFRQWLNFLGQKVFGQCGHTMKSTERHTRTLEMYVSTRHSFIYIYMYTSKYTFICIHICVCVEEWYSPTISTLLRILNSLR